MIKDQLIISINDPILRNHKAYGQELMPGLAYVDLLYQFFAEHGYQCRELELRNLAIFHPLIVSEGADVKLSIECVELNDNNWKVQLDGVGGGSVETPVRYITAEMRRVIPAAFDEQINPAEVVAGCAQALSMAQVYEVCSQQQLVHSGVMKAQGDTCVNPFEYYINLSVSSEAGVEAEDFFFHPALIDGGANAAGVLLSQEVLSEDARKTTLFLPLFYESFYATELIQSEVMVRIRKSSVKKNDELLTWDMEYFNDAGRKIGELKKLSIKMVRDQGAINPSLSETSGVPATTRGQYKTQHDEPPVLSPGWGGCDAAEQLLKTIIAGKLGRTIEEIDSESGYYEMGFDSAMLLEVVSDLEQRLSASLAPTLLFEYTNIQALAGHISETYASPLGVMSAVNAGDAVAPESAAVDAGVAGAELAANHLHHSVGESELDDGVAIIGLSGRYPGARSVDEFWDNLLEGKDCITEIPSSRWDHHELDGVKSGSGKAISKWGGFVDDVDCFDPQFFRISPKDARNIDPQERLFLQVCWEAIEDSGYTPKALSGKSDASKNSRVGVFAGVMHKDYMMLGAEAVAQGEEIPVTLNSAAIANRVSYFCDFHGPSLVVDTACSASMTAIHLALESIRRGECSAALAGGVNLSLHPNKYMTYGMADMFSSDGYCHAFGDGGDGYVSGEGVGAVLLKPLREAVRDGDNIYAVIRGSTINHVGKVSGITVPSPVAQYQVIKECYEKFGIDPRTVSYVEAHGTGTSLGDPIEVQGLSRAFSHFTHDTQFCAIGSVKSNIGHAEAAAGVSGLTKVVMQLRHKTLVPSLHSETINPHLAMSGTPFYVQRKAEFWRQPGVETNGVVASHPRRAGISSFGATGSNVHLIVEEYQAEAVVHGTQTAMPVIIPVSARSEERLKEYLSRILAFVKKSRREHEVGAAETTSLRLSEVAYTLQVGREALNERFVAVVNSMDDLVATLEGYLGGDELPAMAWRGPSKSDNSALSIFGADDAQEMVARWAGQNKQDKIAALWAQGFVIPWERLYGEAGRPRRITLPTYPFAKERFWLKVRRQRGNNVVTGWQNAIHPLVQENTSDFSGQRFSSIVTGNEFFVKDNNHRSATSLPGIAYLEMVREAMLRSAASDAPESSSLKLMDITWSEPLQLDGAPRKIDITLSSSDDDRVFCEIYTDHMPGDDAPFVLFQCEAEQRESGQESKSLLVDVERLKRQLDNRHDYDGSAFYKALEGQCAAYAPYLQGVEGLTVGVNANGQTEVVAKLNISSASEGEKELMALHPRLLMSVLHLISAFDLRKDNGVAASDFVFTPEISPFYISVFNLYGDLGSVRWAWLREGSLPEKAASLIADKALSTYALDIFLCDEAGRVIVSMLGVSLAQDNGEKRRCDNTVVAATLTKTRMIKPYHRYQEKTATATPPDVSEPVAKPDNISLASPETVQSAYVQGEMEKPSWIQLSSVHQTSLREQQSLASHDVLLEMSDYGDGVVDIRLSAPAGSDTMIERYAENLIQCLDTVNTDDGVKALILDFDTQSLLFGGDNATLADMEKFIASGLLQKIIECSRPVIAVLRGDALGPDWLLASVCDFMVCSEEGRYGQPRYNPQWIHHPEEKRLMSVRFGADAADELYESNQGVLGKDLRGIGIGAPVLASVAVEPFALDMAYRLSSMPSSSLSALKRHLSRSFVKEVAGFVERFTPAVRNKKGDESGPLASMINPFDDAYGDVSDDLVGKVVATSREVVLDLDTVRIESLNGNIANVVLCDRTNRNAFEEGFVSDVMNAFDYLNQHPEFKVVVLTGYDHYFSLGGTKQGLLAIQDNRAKYSDAPLYELPINCRVPVISAMQGHGIGAGWSFGMFADLQVFASESRYATRFMQFGFTPGFGSTLIFPERLGRDLGWEVLYVARGYSGGELSERWTKATVKPRSTVQNYALAVAAVLAQKSRDELVKLKRQNAQRLQEQLAEVVSLEQELHDKTFVGNKETLARIQQQYEDVTEPSQRAILQRGMSKPSFQLAEPQTLVPTNATQQPTTQGARSVLVEVDPLDALKSTVALDEIGMIPTLNKTGYMMENLTSYSVEFARSAGISGADVLDLGCAYGVATIAALERGARVTAVDMEHKHLSILTDRLTTEARARVNTQQATLPEIDFEDGSFSAVHAARVFHFLPPEDIRTMLRKIFRWLMPNGKLFLITDTPYVGVWSKMVDDYETRKHDGDPWPGFIPDLGRYLDAGERVMAPSSINSLDPDILRRECKAAGFVVERVGFEGSELHSKIEGSATGKEHVGIVAHKPVFQGEEPRTPRPASPKSVPTGTVLMTDPAARDIKPQATYESLEEVRAFLHDTLAHELDLQPEEIAFNTPFIDLGLDSISGVTWIRKINEACGLSVIATKVYSYPTVDEFAAFILTELRSSGKSLEAAEELNAEPAQLESTSDQLDLIKKELGTTLAQELDLDPSQIAENTPFIDLGLDSISGVTWIRKINENYSLSIIATKVYSHPTIKDFAQFVLQECVKQGVCVAAAENVSKTTPGLPAQEHHHARAVEPMAFTAHTDAAIKKHFPKLISHRDERSRTTMRRTAAKVLPSTIAVIGVSGQFPKARTLNEFWNNLVEGRDCVTEVPADRWDVDRYYDADPQAPGKTHCRWMGALDDVASFDPLFFNISPKEAELMDPQQRLFLQNAWHCIEDAGYTSKQLSGSKCGVFAGSTVGDYGKLTGDERLTLPGLMGDTSSMLAARISYFLNLQGPCLSIDTACSSSLVAIASACDSLVTGGSDLALAGGAYVMSTPEMHIMASKAGMLSEDGRCFTFDQRANGFVPGEGVGVLLLKRLQDAQRDGDHIHAVIKGWGVNQDGKTNGITAPNPESQTRLESDVYKKFDIDPKDIQLIEAHGTGTKLGDPIEIEGLKSSFASCSGEKAHCALGSVKSNIGHLLTAAGVAGMIKLLLSIKHKGIPPTVNFENLNEHIVLKDSPFYINDAYSEWKVPQGKARCSAISSFGFSGTNAHIVVEEYTSEAAHARQESAPSGLGPCLVTLSARDETRLHEYAEDLLAHLDGLTFDDSEASLSDLAYTLQLGREQMDERIAIVSTSLAGLKVDLSKYIDGVAFTARDRVYHSGNSTAAEADEESVKRWLQESRLDELARYWVGGGTPDWSELYGDARPSRISAPTYPFAKRRYWVESVNKVQDREAQGAETLLGSRLNLAVGQTGLELFETTLPYRHGEYINGYGIAEHRFAPASVFVSLLLSAANNRAAEGEKSTVVLNNIKFHTPLYLSDVAERVQTVLNSGDEAASGNVKAFVLDSDSEWQLLASADVAQAGQPICALQLQLAGDEMPPVDGDSFYEGCAHNGIQYRDGFKSVVSLRRGADSGVAELHIPAVITADDVVSLNGVPHPTIVDSLFQILMSVIPAEGEGKTLFMPSGINSFAIHGRCERVTTARFQLRSSEEPGRHVADFILYDDAGHPVAEAVGLSVVETLASEVGCKSGSGESSSDVSSLMSASNLSELTEDELYQVIVDGIARMLNDVLSVDVEEEFANQQKFLDAALIALGVDSLTTQELCKRIRIWLDVDVPIEKILGGGKVCEIVDFVQVQLILRGVGGVSRGEVVDEDDVDAFVL